MKIIKTIQFAKAKIRQAIRFVNQSNFEKEIKIEEVPQNDLYKKKVGKKRVSETITKEMMERENISISAITGNYEKQSTDQNGTIEWDEMKIKTLSRSRELTEQEEEAILQIEKKDGSKLFSPHFLITAKKIKYEWGLGNGRPTIVKNLMGITGASDGNVGKCVAIFNKIRDKNIDSEDL